MERVSNTLQRIMAELLQRLPAEQLPEAAWAFAAGKAVAEKTRVLSCEKEILVVEVPDPNWRAQLYAMSPQFLARLNQFVRIERIEFKLAQSQDPAPAAGAASVTRAPAAGAASVAAYPAAKPPRRTSIKKGTHEGH